jgi:arylformamidase
MSSFIDISPLISSDIAVYPLDVPCSIDTSLSFEKGDHLRLSSMQATLHVGAHADAPNHYHVEGRGIDCRDLDFYYGPCQVVDVRGAKGGVGFEDIGEEIRQERLLFKTDSFKDPCIWQEDFFFLEVELIDRLAEKKVRLVGIDTPSVDAANTKNMAVHQRIFHHDMAILEGLVLKEVPAGDYHLIALPLKVAGGDAAPVRAVLLPSFPRT